MIVRTVAGKRIPIAAGDVYFGSAASVGQPDGATG